MGLSLSLSFCLSPICTGVYLRVLLPASLARSLVSVHCLNLSPLPDHLSINLIQGPLLPYLPAPFTPSPWLPRLQACLVFTLLTFSVLPHISWSQRPLSSFFKSLFPLCFSTSSLLFWIFCSCRVVFRAPSLISALRSCPAIFISRCRWQFSLAFHLNAPYPSIPPFRDSFLASYLFMFSLVPV